MKFNWRRIPHPIYGNFGGATNTSSNHENPIDWMDQAFKSHDIKLKSVKTNYGKAVADSTLLTRLIAGDPSKLARPIYGRLYRLGTIAVFYVITLIQDKMY